MPTPATNFPGSLDTATNLPDPTSSDTLDGNGGVDPNLDHDYQHGSANKAIIALETKLGITNSLDTSSVDYKLSQLGIIPVSSLPPASSVPRGQNIYALEVAAATAKPTGTPSYNSSAIKNALLLDYIFNEGPMGTTPSTYIGLGGSGSVNDYINSGQSRGHFTWGTDSSSDSPYLSACDGFGTTHSYAQPTTWTWVVLCQPNATSLSSGFYPMFHEQSGNGHQLGIDTGVPAYWSNGSEAYFTGFTPSVNTTLMIAGGYDGTNACVAAFDAAHLTSTWETTAKSWTGPSPGSDSLFLLHNSFSQAWAGKGYFIRLFNRLLTNTELQELAMNPYLVYGATPTADSYWLRGNNASGTPEWFDVTNADITRASLSAAKSGANTDITSLTGITGQIEFAQGASVASANNLALGTDGNVFHITGTTQINLLSATNWQAGSMVGLIFDGVTTVKHNQAVSGANKPILLVGAADYVTAAGSILVLIYDGTDWYDIRCGLTSSGGGGSLQVGSITGVTKITPGTNVTVTAGGTDEAIISASGGGGVGSSPGAVVTSIDAAPATANSHDQEFTDNGSALTFQVSSGTLTNQSITNWVSNATPSAPSWNSNLDVASGLVMQPVKGGSTKVYGSFAPTPSTAWAAMAKVRLLNGYDSDDRINFVLSKDAPSTGTDETGNGVNLQIRNNGSNSYQVRAYENNNGGNSHTSGGDGYTFNTHVYLLIASGPDNHIYVMAGTNGLDWHPVIDFTGDNVNGNVAYWWVSVQDSSGNDRPAAAVVDFVRFLEGSNNALEMGSPIQTMGTILTDSTPTAGSTNRGSLYLVESETYTYDELIFLDSPSHYWPMNESSGTTMVDQVGSSNGTLNGGITIGATGLVNDGETAYTFDGTSGHISMAAPLATTSNAPFSVEGWAYFDASSNFQIFLGSTDQNSNGWVVYFDNSNKFNINTYSGGSGGHTAAVASTAGLKHYVVTYDGTTFNGYLNKVLVFSVAGTYVSSSSNAFFGYYSTAPFYGRNTNQKVALYNYALSLDTITKHYNAGATGSYSTGDTMMVPLKNPDGSYGLSPITGPGISNTGTPQGRKPYTPCRVSDFVQVNTGSNVTIANSTWGTIGMSATHSGGDSLKWIGKAIPSTPYSVILKVLVDAYPNTNYSQVGFGWYDSGSGKFHDVDKIFSSNTFEGSEWNSSTSYNTQWFTGATFDNDTSEFWIRMTDDGTNLTWEYSRNAILWTTLGTTGRTSWLTPTHVGLYIDCQNSTSNVTLELLSWEIT